MVITDMQMRQRDVAALDAKYTKELADAKAENDALRDDVAAGRRQLHIKAILLSRCVNTTPAAWISVSGGELLGWIIHWRTDHYTGSLQLEDRSILMTVPINLYQWATPFNMSAIRENWRYKYK